MSRWCILVLSASLVATGGLEGAAEDDADGITGTCVFSSLCQGQCNASQETSCGRALLGNANRYRRWLGGGERLITPGAPSAGSVAIIINKYNRRRRAEYFTTQVFTFNYKT